MQTLPGKTALSFWPHTFPQLSEKAFGLAQKEGQTREKVDKRLNTGDLILYSLMM